MAKTQTATAPKAQPDARAGAEDGHAKDHAEVTYLPLNRDDPHTIEWHGIRFQAFVPVKISLKHTYLVPQRVEHALADGSVVTKHIEKPMALVELARGNPSFAVDGVQAERKQGMLRTPESAPEYRGYCTRWILASTEAKAMDARWDAEHALRERCNVDAADIAYLRPFFEAQKEQLGERAETAAKKKGAVVA